MTAEFLEEIGVSALTLAIDAIPYAWGVAGGICAVGAIILISMLTEKPETYNHNRYGN
jgi:hypothetical protein